MTVRTMEIGDYDAVYGIWVSCAGMGLNNLDDSKDGVARFLERNPDTCLVAEEEGRIVGAILVGSDGRRGYIYHAAVSPDYRRRGIGAHMVEAAMEALRSIGIHKAALVVFGRNEAGNAFWEQLGFTIREDIVYRNRALVEMVRCDT